MAHVHVDKVRVDGVQLSEDRNTVATGDGRADAVATDERFIWNTMCSKAMALHAEGETRVFGDEFGKCSQQSLCGSEPWRFIISKSNIIG